jgi:hypothetical protein
MEIDYGFKTDYKLSPKMTEEDWDEIKSGLRTQDMKLFFLLFVLFLCVLSIAVIWS